MLCESPIQLKSGLVVPCGKCVLCLSARRDEWSARLQLHTEQFESMPFFVTLTYDPDNVVYGETGFTLVKSHVQMFIKRLKDKFNLYNSDFSYFGCGEYGDKGDPALDRPHYHLILFAFPQLEEAFQRGAKIAQDLIYDSWKFGFVTVYRAQWSGIHYVTKYVMKYLDEYYQGKQKPFIIFTRGIGKNWFESSECKYLKRRINDFCCRFKGLVPSTMLDYTSPSTLADTSRDAMLELQRFMPKMVCTLPQGNKVPLPRYYRKKLIGSFEHFKDSPFWLYNFYSQVYEASRYIADHGEYDVESGLSYHDQIVQFAQNRIYQRLQLKKQPLLR